MSLADVVPFLDHLFTRDGDPGYDDAFDLDGSGAINLGNLPRPARRLGHRV